MRCSEVNEQDGLTERLGSCALRLNSVTDVRDIARKRAAVLVGRLASPSVVGWLAASRQQAVYALFANEQLAQMVQRRCRSMSDLA